MILCANDECYSLCVNSYIHIVYMYIVIYICLEFQEKEHIYFSNYEGIDEFMYGTCGVRYLHQGQGQGQGQEPLN